MHPSAIRGWQASPAPKGVRLISPPLSSTTTKRRVMMKEKLGAMNALYPTPTVLVGATVSGKPHFITIAHIGIMTHNHISLGMGKIHYTNAGIRENKTFSVCLPSENLVIETDYCGIMTGKN